MNSAVSATHQTVQTLISPTRYPRYIFDENPVFTKEQKECVEKFLNNIFKKNTSLPRHFNVRVAHAKSAPTIVDDFDEWELIDRDTATCSAIVYIHEEGETPSNTPDGTNLLLLEGDATNGYCIRQTHNPNTETGLALLQALKQK